MKNLENLNVTLVFQDLMGKTKLREVLRNVLYKSEVEYERDLKSLSKKIAEDLTKKIDFIFVSAKFSQSEISAFLSGITAAEMPAKPAVIICLHGISFDSSGLVAGWYLEGASGFIAEPFTAFDISDLLNTVIEDRKKTTTTSSSLKARKAANYLLNDAVFLVDELSKLHSQGKEGGYRLKSLKTLNKAFANFYEEDPEAFSLALTEVFEKAKLPVVNNQQLDQKKTVLKLVKHPGTYIWDIMNKRNLSEEKMASLLKLELKDLNDLLWGKANIDQAMAQNLSRALGMSPREWLKLQSDFDTYQQKQTTS